MPGRPIRPQVCRNRDAVGLQSHLRLGIPLPSIHSCTVGSGTTERGWRSCPRIKANERKEETLMVTTATVDDRRETVSLIGSDKVEGTAVYGANDERIGSVQRVMVDK